MTRTRINLAGYARLHGLEAAPRAEQVQHARAAGWTVSGDTLTRYSRATIALTDYARDDESVPDTLRVSELDLSALPTAEEATP